MVFQRCDWQEMRAIAIEKSILKLRGRIDSQRQYHSRSKSGSGDLSVRVFFVILRNHSKLLGPFQSSHVFVVIGPLGGLPRIQIVPKFAKSRKKPVYIETQPPRVNQQSDISPETA